MRYLLDTGVWIALIDRRDQYHKYSINFFKTMLNKGRYIEILIPWPILYEFLKGQGLELYKNFFIMLDQLREAGIKITKYKQYINDDTFLLDAFNGYKKMIYRMFPYSQWIERDRGLSLVDIVILKIAEKERRENFYLVSYDRLLKRLSKERGIQVFE